MANQNRSKMSFGAIALSTILMLILSAVFMYFFSWWSCIVATAIVALQKRHSALAGFVLGFFSVAFLWLGVAVFHSFPNQGLLADQVGKLIGGMNATSLILLTAFLGGLCGGMGGWSGSLLRNALK